MSSQTKSTSHHRGSHSSHGSGGGSSPVSSPKPARSQPPSSRRGSSSAPTDRSKVRSPSIRTPTTAARPAPEPENPGRRREDLMRFTLHSELTSLVEEVDKRVFVQLRDGRTYLGILRLFDQFANIVLTDTVERFYVHERFGDVKLGMFLIKGESVVMLGEVDEQKEATLAGRIEEKDLAQAYMEAERLRQIADGKRKGTFDFDGDN